jgi:hypothetical protein
VPTGRTAGDRCAEALARRERRRAKAEIAKAETLKWKPAILGRAFKGAL